MTGIFISYRRADSDGWTGRLRDTLRARFGKRVFHDVDNIPDGEIFSDVIDRALKECAVALIIIGPSWANARDEHGRRLDQEDDWVRTEAAMVLNRKIRVIPVLVGGATLPRAAELPEELRSITKRQAREIRSTSWESDVNLLINQLEQILDPHRRSVWLYALPALALGVLAVAAGIRYFGAPEPAPPTDRVATTPVTSPAPRETPAHVPPVTSTAPAIPPVAPAQQQPSATPERAAPSPPPPKAASPSPSPAKPPDSAARPAPKPAVSASVSPERAQPKAVRPEPAKRTQPAQESERPAAPQKAPENGDRVAATPVAPKAVPEKIARAGTINLPNRPPSARELKVGDSWTYRLREIRFSKNLATVTHEISGGDASGIRESVRIGGGRTADADANAVSQRRLALEPRIYEQQIDREARLFEFAPFMSGFLDLQPGVAWSKIPTGAADSEWRFRGKVVGRERVSVPAGSFDAIRVDLEGNLDVAFPTTRDMAAETNPTYQAYSIWYVSEVGRAVKYVRRTYNRARVMLDHEQYELVTYQAK
ncbi:MAG: TIR domain-containing protein [Pseudomonadota bacterium]